MRVAKPNELKTHAMPILTARVSESKLAKWFPVRFQQITDPQEAAEPSKASNSKPATILSSTPARFRSNSCCEFQKRATHPRFLVRSSARCRFRADGFSGGVKTPDCHGIS
jgi:hypothetical protein